MRKSCTDFHDQRSCGRIPDYEGATVSLARRVEVPGIAFPLDSGSSRRNNQVDPWRRNPDNDVLACVRVFK
eukprot:2783704-Pyramimonas_sp.AAC.1